MPKYKETQKKIGEIVRKAENDYISGITTLGKYVEFSQHENIEKIDAYLNSKHTSGETDSLDREKPFFNIVVAAVNIWYRATDIDRKQIRIKPTKLSHRVMAFIASLHFQDWMRRELFGATLNGWGRAESEYGSAILKFVEKGDKLHSEVTPWNRMISDTVDFENNPKIEVLYLTPAQLRDNESYDQTQVDGLLDALEKRQTIDKQNQDNKSEYIKIYEVHGKMPLSLITGYAKDDKTYAQQMQAYAYCLKPNKDDEYDEFVLYKGREAKDPYMLTHLIKKNGRAQSIGAVEYLFEAQWMVNHSVKLIKDQLDLASKTILQTSDGSFIGQNVLTGLEVGDILIHKVNEPLTQVNNKADITALQNFGSQWMSNAKELTSTPDALRGGTQPAGTAWRQVEAIQQEATSLFEQMTENKALDIERMMREYVIPHLKKQMDTAEELAITLDEQGIKEFDSMFVPNEVIRRSNDHIRKSILSGNVAEAPDPAMIENGIKNDLSQLGNQRFIKPSDIDTVKWNDALKDLEWEVEVDPSQEAEDREAIMTTLTTVLKTIAMNPAILQDPNMKMLFNKILEQTNAVSPLELSNTPPPTPPQPQPQPAGAPAPAAPAGQ